MPQQEIRCTVTTCYYNEDGRDCRAATIMVQNDTGTLQGTKMEMGTLGGEARQSNQTLCQTFIPREKGPKSGIQRLP